MSIDSDRYAAIAAITGEFVSRTMQEARERPGKQRPAADPECLARNIVAASFRMHGIETPGR